MIRVLQNGRTPIMVLLIANGAVQAGAAVISALAVGYAFRSLGSSAPTDVVDVALVAAALAAAAALTALLRERERIDAERLGQSYSHELRMRLFEHLTAMSPRAVNNRSHGSTALRFIGDLSALRKWVSLGLSRLAVASTMVVATLAALAFIDPVLAAAPGLATLIGGAGAVAQGPSLREATRRARQRRSRLAGQVTEAIGAVGVLQVNDAVDREQRRVRRQSRRLRNAMIERARRLGRLQALAEATGSGAIAMLLVAALVFGIGAPEVAAGMTVVGLLVPQLRGLARVQEFRQHQRVAMDAIRRFLDRPTLLSEPDVPIDLADGDGVLELKGATFAEVTDITAVARPGQQIAVVGPNGAGKSTLLAMIARLVDLDGGAVTLDGVDLSQVPLSQARRRIGVAGPDLRLMRGSLRRNITYRRRDASDDEIARVVERCGLTQIVADLPDGLETKVAEGGANLSSGEQQRVLLARALVGEPQLLLLDEADANLDALTTSILDDVLDAHRGVAIVVTHRRDRVESADLVWHLADGRLTEVVTPTAAFSTDSDTARLFVRDRADVETLEAAR